MPLHIFINDESGYRKWYQDNPDGYVINSYRRISPNYMVLHQANCYTISHGSMVMFFDINDDKYTSNQYIKICSKNPTELLDWIKKQGGKWPSKPCRKCKPENNNGWKVYKLFLYPDIPEINVDQGETVLKMLPLNIILYGPPGTGKTYATKQLAVEICDGFTQREREKVLERYNTLCSQNRVEFVTFHQSFSYEDFVEGLRPSIDEESTNTNVEYECRPGIFKRVCIAAEAALNAGISAKDGIQLGNNRRLFKMSLGNTGIPEEAYIYSECMENGYVLMSWGEHLDFTGCKTTDDITEKLRSSIPDFKTNDYKSNIRPVYTLISEIRVGDLILVSDGNTKYRAIGEVTGEYEYADRQGKDSFSQKRKVKWIRQYQESQPIDLIFDKRLTQRTIYLMDQSSIKRAALEAAIAPRETKLDPDNYVLIIDEINRANISKVLGELISLLEPDKRLGAKEELRIRLPYSQKGFGVPKNLYVIGTMNTADRSIALLDTALRRRFEFHEINPDYSVLKGAGGGCIPDENDSEINLRYVLMIINDRLEFLLGRDQRIGHAYLTDVFTLEDLNCRFTKQIIPLLQEYFYEDWAGIAKVLAVPKGVTPFMKKNIVDAANLFETDSDDFLIAESRDCYSVSNKLTGDMYRGLYSGHETNYAEKLASSK